MSDKKYDLIIIGSGPGGYVAAIKASQAGIKTLLIEKKHLGGICLNWGCIPTKALLKSAEVYQQITHASDYGLEVKGASFNYEKIVKRSRKIADVNSKGVSFLMKKNKVTVLSGEASILAQGHVKVNADTYETKDIIIATGASARELPPYPIDGTNYITYRHALQLTDRPEKLLVIGSGAIGAEFSYYFNALGTEVHMVEMLKYILPVEDEETSTIVQAAFEKQGIHCYPDTTIESTQFIQEGQIEAVLKLPNGDSKKLSINRVLVAVGMVPNTKDLGLQSAAVRLDKNGFIQTDKVMQTSVPHIYAIGDVAGHQLLAHKASAEAEIAIAHIAGHDPVGMDYNLIPGCTYCNPQIASIGKTEQALKKEGTPYKVGKFPFMANGKARAIGKTEGHVKLLFGKEFGELLGAHIVGADATEMLAELGLAMKMESTYEEIMKSVHAHPTLSEAVMEAAMNAHSQAVHI